MTVISADNYSSKVTYSTDWLDLEKYKGLESGFGVFIFSNFFYQVKYVGIAREGEMINSIQESIGIGKSVGVTKIKVLYTKTESQALVIRRRLIDRYNPILNLG
ncbi:MAG TPA: hypothetical protein DIW31_05770 [Bacteroidales bacterium]|nr:hypothetical protein [Bacteroidales bacterium]